MFSSIKTLFRHKDNLFLVLKKMPFDYFHKEGQLNLDLFHLWKEHVGAEHVLKFDNHFLFCQRIEELEIIEDEPVLIEEPPKPVEDDNSNSNP
jgi:hypothetical protein